MKTTNPMQGRVNREILEMREPPKYSEEINCMITTREHKDHKKKTTLSDCFFAFYVFLCG